MHCDEGLATTIRFIHTNLELLDDVQVNVGDEPQLMPSPMATIIAEKGIPVFRDPSDGPPCLTKEEKAVIIAKRKGVTNQGAVVYLDWTPDAWEYGCQVASDLVQLGLRQDMTQYRFDNTMPGGKQFLHNMKVLRYKHAFDSAVRHFFFSSSSFKNVFVLDHPQSASTQVYNGGCLSSRHIENIKNSGESPCRPVLAGDRKERKEEAGGRRGNR